MMDTTELNGMVNGLLHDIEVPLDVMSSYADAVIYDTVKDDTTKSFSPEYMKFLLSDRRRDFFARAVRHGKGGDELCITNEIYRDFNFIEIALAVDMFPNLCSITFTTQEISPAENGTLTFTDEVKTALNTTIRVNAFGVRLREWFSEKVVDEINRQVCIHNDKFNNAMCKDNLMLLNEMNGLLDICATVYSSMGKTVGNSTMPLFDGIPKSMMEVPVFIFTDYLER